MSSFLSLNIHFQTLIESLAIGAQPVEPDNMPIEGSLETSYLLEQVCFRDSYYIALFIGPYYRLLLSVELYVSSGWKIHTSRAKIYFEKSNRFHLLCNPLRVHQRRHLIPQATRTLKSLTQMNRLLHLLFSLWVPRRRDFIETL